MLALLVLVAHVYLTRVFWLSGIASSLLYLPLVYEAFSYLPLVYEAFSY